MKRIIVIIIFISFLIPLLVKADLTEEQSKAIASFGKNMIIKQNDKVHQDNNGFGLMAYSMGSRRTEGYNNQLSYFYKDYKSVNYIGGNKWAFDCASWVSYVYKHVLNINTFKNGTAYVVSTFVSKASNDDEWYFIMRNVPVEKIDYSRLKLGDLVVQEGSHIMLYIGNGQIAHVSTSAIKKGENLGAEIVNLNEKMAGKKLTIIRLKKTDYEPNTIITWPDTKQQEELYYDDLPTIDYQLNEIKNNELIVDITFKDDKALTNYQLNQSSSTPKDWLLIQKKKEFKTTFKVTKDGTYYIHVKDNKDQVVTKKFTINAFTNLIKIDNYNVVYNKNLDNYQLIINCINNNCQNYKFSLNKNDYQDNNIFYDIKEGNYILTIKDQNNNTGDEEIVINKDIVPELKIDYDKDTYAKQKELKIDNPRNDIVDYQITTNDVIPTTFMKYNGNAYQINENNNYYIYVKNINNNITYEKLEVTNIDNDKPIVNNITYKKGLINNYVIIDAIDNECGIEGYSNDGLNFESSNEITITKDTKNIYVKDKCGNILEYPIEQVKNNWLVIIAIIIILLIVIYMIYTIIKKKSKK